MLLNYRCVNITSQMTVKKIAVPGFKSRDICRMFTCTELVIQIHAGFAQLDMYEQKLSGTNTNIVSAHKVVQPKAAFQ